LGVFFNSWAETANFRNRQVRNRDKRGMTAMYLLKYCSCYSKYMQVWHWKHFLDGLSL